MDTRIYLKKVRLRLQLFVAKVLPHYVQNRNYINKGNSEANTIRHIVQVVLIAKIAYNQLPTWIYMILGVMIIVLYWYLGKFWDMNKGYDCEIEWSNSRNPTLQTIKSSTNTKPTLDKRKL